MEGKVKAEDPINIISRDPQAISVHTAFILYKLDLNLLNNPIETLKKALSIESLAPLLQDAYSKRLLSLSKHSESKSSQPWLHQSSCSKTRTRSAWSFFTAASRRFSEVLLWRSAEQASISSSLIAFNSSILAIALKSLKLM